LNLRPPRPERGGALLAPRIISNFCYVRGSLFSFVHRISVAVSVAVEAGRHAFHVVGMVMRINVFKHLHGDAAEPQNLVNVDTLDGEPSDCRVPEGVNDDISAQPCGLDVCGQCLVDRADRRAVKLDQVLLAQASPTPQVRQESRRQEYMGLAFFAVRSCSNVDGNGEPTKLKRARCSLTQLGRCDFNKPTKYRFSE
jgi:hypothetical protein